AKWHIKPGDTVRSGDVIAEIETDKATMEVEAVDEGVVDALLVPEGTEEVKVNTPIARLKGENGASGKASPSPLRGGDRCGGEAPASSVRAADGQSPPEEPTPPPPAPPRKGEGSGEPSAPRSTQLADPELPADVKLVRVTVRDALRDAMAE